ncbi:MAG: tripartite tricarboxylate transporter substrate binding protein [Thermodesulfobacteriota bacterium]
MRKYSMSFIIIFLMVSMIGWAGAQQAPANYPKRPITVIVPWSPGGGADTQSRAFAVVAPKYFKQPLVIVNKPGASGSVAHTAFRNEKPDGYTLIITGNSPSTIVPNLETVTYDPVNDFEFIGRITNMHNVLVVKKDAPWKTVKEFFDNAKANPGKVRVGTSGANSLDDLMLRRMNQELGIELVGVGFGSSSEGNVAVLGGHIDANFCGALSPVPLISSGEMRALAFTKETRDPAFPDVPTFIELGMDIAVNNSIGLAAPKGTPKEITAFLEDAFKKTIEDPEFQASASKLKLIVSYLNGADFKKVTAGEVAKVRKIVGK